MKNQKLEVDWLHIWIRPGRGEAEVTLNLDVGAL